MLYRRLCTAIALGDVEGQDRLDWELVAAFKPVNENPGGTFSKLIQRDMDACKHWREILIRFNIIDPDDGNVLGDAPAAFFKGAHGADSRIIIGTENRCDVRAHIHEHIGGLISAVGSLADIDAVSLTERKTELFKRLTVALVADFVILSADITDFCMAKLMQIIDRSLGNFPARSRSPGQILCRRDLSQHT